MCVCVHRPIDRQRQSEGERERENARQKTSCKKSDWIREVGGRRKCDENQKMKRNFTTRIVVNSKRSLPFGKGNSIVNRRKSTPKNINVKAQYELYFFLL